MLIPDTLGSDPFSSFRFHDFSASKAYLDHLKDGT